MVVNIHTIHKLMEYKKWWDALLLRFRYYEQRNIQGQQTTFSNDEFMEKAMGRWGDRFRTAKNILKECDMIDVINVRDDETHKSLWRFVKVNYTFNPQSVRTHNIIMEVSKSSLDHQNPWNPSSGKQGDKIQPYYNKNNTLFGNDTQTPNQSATCWGKKNSALDIIKNSDDIRELLTEDEIIQYKYQLKITLKMVELWYKIPKTKEKLYEHFKRLKDKANVYNVKQNNGEIARATFFQTTDRRFDYHSEKWDKVKNFKSSLMQFFKH